MLTSCDRGTRVDYSGPTSEWHYYGGAAGGGHYSPLTQINRDNVEHLREAWVYRTGDYRSFEPDLELKLPNGKTLPGMPSSWQLTPLVVNETLYGCSAFGKVFALDPTTGQEQWIYDPGTDISKEFMLNCRGVSTWEDPTGTDSICTRRIFTGTRDGRLIALDAKTGKPCADFGTNGVVDLNQGLGQHESWEYSVSSPPAILGDKLIVGAFVMDRMHEEMPSGVVRAYSTRSGELVWYWNPVPPGQSPLEAEDDEVLFKRGTPNVWSLISVDQERNLVFLPTGNTSSDFYGGLRNNSDYYSSSVVALNGEDGQIVWHFQMVHHDLWDYDTPAQPTLFEFERDGQTIPALAQPTKMGHLFLLNRETGEPLFPVEERKVPQTAAVVGEYLSPTQPFPTKPRPLHPDKLEPEDAWGLTFWDRNVCRKQLRELNNEGIFTPPSLTGSILFPSDFGGNNWGSPAIDPISNTAVLNSRFLPAVATLIPRAECQAQFDSAVGPQFGTPYCIRTRPLLSPLGIPCSAPPWGTLVAVDLNRGDVLWEKPLGTLEELAPWPFSRIKGAPNIGGPMITASGLVFIASSTDQYLRAFDEDTGEELWKTKLPTGGHATPMSYRVGRDQKQYVVIAVGGHGALQAFGQKPGDYLMAFALRSDSN